MHKINNRGFTLIELLVVIAIIGILSSVVLASLNTAREKARDAARVSDIGQLKLALELYFDSCGEYPNIVNGAALTTTVSNGCTSPTTMADFISVIPTPPTGGTSTVYQFHRVSTTNYCIGVDLEDAGAVPSGDQDCDADGTGTNPYPATTPPNEWYSVGP